MLPREAFWFRCTICADRWPGSQLGGRFSDANDEPICKDCAGLIESAGVAQ
ncbi:MAG: hypothetical protein HYT80_08000 [Euryarchaeota archaeon]|nr:hypothetical protein [Euryarchaeota archaeon]